jgi:hypothetical protein
MWRIRLIEIILTYPADREYRIRTRLRLKLRLRLRNPPSRTVRRNGQGVLYDDVSKSGADSSDAVKTSANSLL